MHVAAAFVAPSAPAPGSAGRTLAGLDVRALDDRLGRAAGELLAATRRRDVLDAAIVLLAHDAIRLSPPILAASNR